MNKYPVTLSNGYTQGLMPTQPNMLAGLTLTVAAGLFIANIGIPAHSTLNKNESFLEYYPQHNATFLRDLSIRDIINKTSSPMLQGFRAEVLEGLDKATEYLLTNQVGIDKEISTAVNKNFFDLLM